jgi:MFS transporter, PAT family, beta-lactamase induction signal transducer AmpG
MTTASHRFAGLGVYGERRIAVMLALGFASGLPFLLIFDTLSAWLRQSNLSLQTIAFFGLATLVYAFKFLWAPLLDRTRVPFLDAKLGHRRAWMLVVQLAIASGLGLIAVSDPATNLGAVAAFAVLTGFFGATQDIVIDAWRIEATETDRQGAMAAAYTWGFRIAMMVAGAVPLILSDWVGWNFSYAVMSAFMLVGIGAVLLAPMEKKRVIKPIPIDDIPSRPAAEALEWLARLALLLIAALLLGTGLSGNMDILEKVLGVFWLDPFAAALRASWSGTGAALFSFSFVMTGLVLVGLTATPVPNARTRPGTYLYYALGEPLAVFFRRYGRSAGLILAMICFYRLSDFLLNVMTPFYLDVGYTTLQIAEVRKVFGLFATVFGVFLGGLSVARLGLMNSLLIGVFAQPLSNAMFVLVAMAGPDMPMLFAVIGVENITSGFAGVALIAYMSSLTSEGFTATQYAVFSSLYAVPGKLLASQSGAIIEGVARGSESGGLGAMFLGLFQGGTGFASAMEKSQVSPAALGAGYTVFFLYSALAGALGVILTLILWFRRRESTTPPD